MMCIKHNCASFGQETCKVCELETALQELQARYDAMRAENAELKNALEDSREISASLRRDIDTLRIVRG